MMKYSKEYIAGKIGGAIGAAVIIIVCYLIACKIYEMFSGVL